MTPSALQDLPLRDIHLPPAISAWPPAFGWWIVAAAVLILIVAAWMFARRYRRRNAYRRAAREQVQAIFAHYQQHRDQSRLAADCSALLRRVAVTAFGRTSAGITGERWLDFLDAALAHKHDAPRFRQQKDALLTAPYQPMAGFSVEQLQQAMLFWIRHHRV